MNKNKLIERIDSIINKVDDEKVLKDMLNLVNGVYKHYKSGTWER